MSYITLNDINPYIISCGYMNKSNCPPPGISYEERTVKWHEVELILWGEGYIITEGQKLSTSRGDIFFRKPGMKVQGFSPYHCYLIVFDISFSQGKNVIYSDPNYMNADKKNINDSKLEQLNNCYLDYSFPYHMQTIKYDKFKELFSEAYDDYICCRKFNQFYLKTRLMQILMLMHEELTTQTCSNQLQRSLKNNYEKVMQVKNYIDSNIPLSFELQSLSDIAGLSPNFFCKIFKDIIGDAPINYINKCKINMAKKMLIETNKQIKQIALECGFENDTYFFTLFKSMAGMTPATYRERHSIYFL